MNELIERLEKIGAKRWTKNGFDRMYIEIETAIDLYRAIPEEEREWGDFGANRRERANGKIFFDILKGEFEFKDLGYSAKETFFEIVKYYNLAV